MLSSTSAFNKIDMVDASFYRLCHLIDCVRDEFEYLLLFIISQFPCLLLPPSPLQGDQRVECNQTQGTLWATRSIC